ncbi:MAG: glycosyltransferase family 4 protein [Elusimicrobia bacterium]|nr:glycosyltransferase family 4 protein [Elusimicrobiota bacterium]
MKILKIVDFSEWNIISYQVLYLAVELKKKGVDVSVLCPQGSRLYAECVKNQIHADFLGFLFKFGMVKNKNYDIIHFYSPKSFSGLTYKFVGKNKKIVFSHMKFLNKSLPKLRSIEKYIAKFIVPSKSFYDNLREVSIAKENIFTILPAIKITRWESAMRVKLMMFNKTPYQIVSISMDKSLKEQFLFLKIAKRALEIFPEDISFTLLGNTSEKLRDMARKIGVSPKINILGNRNDVPEFMAIAHIFVKTTLIDSLSLSLIEAQASGVPCIIPRLKGLGDFTLDGKNGILVEPGNIDSYASAIIKILKDSALALKISKGAFDFIDNNMSIDIAANLLLSVYEDILTERGNKAIWNKGI